MERKTKKITGQTDIREDIVKALESAYPEGEVDMSVDTEPDWFGDIYDTLKAKLHAIPGALCTEERYPDGREPGTRTRDWDEDEEDEGDFDHPPDSCDGCATYHLFFMQLADPKFQYDTDTLTDNEAGKEIRIDGKGYIGCVVAISMIAPLALIVFNAIEQYENGESTLPDIELGAYTLDDHPIDPEAYFREMFDEEGVLALRGLREAITEALAACGIEPLPEGEAPKLVTWLRIGEDTFFLRSEGHEFPNVGRRCFV